MTDFHKGFLKPDIDNIEEEIFFDESGLIISELDDYYKKKLNKKSKNKLKSKKLYMAS